MIFKGKKLYIIAVLVISALTLSFRPGMWLVHKSPNAQPAYVKGWEEGCISGTNSYSLLYAPIMDKPFIKDIGAEPAASSAPAAPESKENKESREFYRTGWNEGFTLCRYYQTSVYELMQFAILIITLLAIGYLIARKR